VILDRGLGKPTQVATFHGSSTQVQVSAADYLAALKQPKVINATQRVGKALGNSKPSSI
jgi:hypothetical protein